MADRGGHDFGPLPSVVVKGLGDKLYDKRKNAALEVERLVKQLAAGSETSKVLSLTGVLRNEFVHSTNANARKGGLIGLAATAIALGQQYRSISTYLTELVPPVLTCFNDADSRVRYYACEALYNITKVAREDVLPFFVRIFDGLCKLSADNDPSVKNGAELLDRLLKDVVTESTSFDIESFVPLLSERIYAVNTYVRQFLVSWLTVLDSVPNIELLDYLPKFLNGLFKILSDPEAEIRRMCESVLGEFLREIKTADHVDHPSMILILVAYCQCDDLLTQFTAVTWINEFIALSKQNMIQFTSNIVGGILPLLASEIDAKLRELAVTTNQSLMKLLSDSPEDLQSFDIGATLHALTSMLGEKPVNTRLAALRWILMLHVQLPDQIFQQVDEFVPMLLRTLSDPTEKVVLLDLEVLSEISSCPDGGPEAQRTQADSFFNKFVLDLMSLFSRDRELLEKQGSFIIRQLCLLLNSEKIYRALADILLKEDDLEFASLMVQNLNIILMTSSELFGLRQQLKSMATEESLSLFCVLYRSWSHSPTATFSLCLLSQVYDHACNLLNKFGEFHVTVPFLVEVDKLIQLLESPIFVYLRLQLLEPQRYSYLIKCLYGLLMLLPQSSAYHLLKSRLDCVPAIVSVQFDEQEKRGKKHQKGNIGINIPFDDLLGHFDNIQKQHAEAEAASHKLRTNLLDEFTAAQGGP